MEILDNIIKIEEWLDNNGISNYSISEDLYITVYSNVNLNGKLKGDTLPVKFKIVDGYFDISNNKLVSLLGSPQIVKKDFNCSNNNLESLFEGPHSVGDFDCSNNNLNKLSYSPKDVKGYYNCSNNSLISIKGSPRRIEEYFKCSNNKIESLIGAPKYVGTYFDCSNNNLKKLSGGPNFVGQDYICFENNLTNLDNIADEIGWDLVTDIRLNHLESRLNEENSSIRYKGNEVISHIYKPIVSLNTIDEISAWLIRYGIKDFTILNNNTVDVPSDVRLSNSLGNLLKLPLKFNKVDGHFDISDNELNSLDGCPEYVKGDFIAHKNELSSLKGSPKEVDGNFIVLQNNINSLKYSPLLIKGDFICSHNPIQDLDDLNSVEGYIFTGFFLAKIKHQKFNYKNFITYKYKGDDVINYLNDNCVVYTEEEIAFENTRNSLKKVISEMIYKGDLKNEMINDVLINNLVKYHLFDLKDELITIKNLSKDVEKKILSTEEIKRLVFIEEL